MPIVRRFSLFVLLFFSGIVIAANTALERGNALIAKGDPKEAERVFRQALAKDPNNPVYEAQLGLALVAQHRYDDAEVELDKLLKSSPNDPAALWYKAQKPSRDTKRSCRCSTRSRRRSSPRIGTSPHHFAICST
jgi:tetratricopeptide (TPR) repeat protein